MMCDSTAELSPHPHWSPREGLGWDSVVQYLPGTIKAWGVIPSIKTHQQKSLSPFPYTGYSGS